MRLWRLCKQRHVASAFSGLGAQLYGGRWNHRGDRMVYASTSLSIAVLEIFVHLEPNVLPDDLWSVSAELNLDAISHEAVTEQQLPGNWRDYPAPGVLQDLGSTWIREVRSLALLVPSAVNPEELNVLLNPLHPEMSKLRDVTSKPYIFDPRMRK